MPLDLEYEQRSETSTTYCHVMPARMNIILSKNAARLTN